MHLTTGKLVNLAHKMNRVSEEIDVALKSETQASYALRGSLHNSLEGLGRMLRPFT
jgi:hypothetical protein